MNTWHVNFSSFWGHFQGIWLKNCTIEEHLFVNNPSLGVCSSLNSYFKSTSVRSGLLKKIFKEVNNVVVRIILWLLSWSALSALRIYLSYRYQLLDIHCLSVVMKNKFFAMSKKRNKVSFSLDATCTVSALSNHCCLYFYWCTCQLTSSMVLPNQSGQTLRHYLLP